MQPTGNDGSTPVGLPLVSAPPPRLIDRVWPSRMVNSTGSIAFAVDSPWDVCACSGDPWVRVRFWEAIADGVSSEEAGVSQAVESRWFREAGGMCPHRC